MNDNEDGHDLNAGDCRVSEFCRRDGARHCTACNPAEDTRCGACPPNVGGPVPCHLEHGHDGDHVSSTGCAGGTITWSDDRCPSRPATGDLRCVLTAGHPDSHLNFQGIRWADPARCGEPHPHKPGVTCEHWADSEHYGRHTTFADGPTGVEDVWSGIFPQCDAVAAQTLDPATYRCTLAAGHPGAHQRGAVEWSEPKHLGVDPTGHDVYSSSYVESVTIGGANPRRGTIDPPGDPLGSHLAVIANEYGAERVLTRAHEVLSSDPALVADLRHEIETLTAHADANAEIAEARGHALEEARRQVNRWRSAARKVLGISPSAPVVDTRDTPDGLVREIVAQTERMLAEQKRLDDGWSGSIDEVGRLEKRLRDRTNLHRQVIEKWRAVGAEIAGRSVSPEGLLRVVRKVVAERDDLRENVTELRASDAEDAPIQATIACGEVTMTASVAGGVDGYVECTLPYDHTEPHAGPVMWR